MKLLKLRLKNFKGKRDFTFEPNGGSVSVFGENEAGKSTLEDAQCWLIADTDRFGNSTGYFSLKPIIDGQVLHGADYSVEGTYTHNGETIVLKKVYQEIWTRNRRSAEEELDRHTTNHYINGEKVKKRDYEDFVDGIMSNEMFLLLSNPKYLAKKMHKSDRRKILTQMSDDYTVEDVIAGNPKLERYPRILDGSTHEQAEDRLNTIRKDLDEKLKDFPGRIDENQNKIEQVEGVEEAKEKVESLKTKKEKIEAKRSEVKSGGRLAELKVRKQEVEAKKQKAKNEFQQSDQEALSDKRQKVNELQDKVDEAESNWRDAKRDYEKSQSHVKQIETIISKVEKEIQEVKDREPKPANAFEPEQCPVCEQTMPDAEEYDYEEYVAEFNAEKAKELKSLNKELEQAKEDLAEQKDAEKQAGNNAANMQGKLNQRKQALENAQIALREAKQNRPEFDGSEFDDQVEVIDQKISNHREEKQSQLDKLNGLIDDLDEQIKAAREVISKAEDNAKYRDRINELNQKRKEIAGKLEEVEYDLHILELYHRAEGEYITANVNDMFDIVEWKLFKMQMNGGIKPICEARVDGVPFDDVNTAKKIQAGIDIIQTLSEYFEIEAPVFVDNAEGVGAYPDSDLQIISLVYSKGDEEIRVESDLDYHLQTANPANRAMQNKINESAKAATA